MPAGSRIVGVIRRLHFYLSRFLKKKKTPTASKSPGVICPFPSTSNNAKSSAIFSPKSHSLVTSKKKDLTLKKKRKRSNHRIWMKTCVMYRLFTDRVHRKSQKNPHHNNNIMEKKQWRRAYDSSVESWPPNALTWLDDEKKREWSLTLLPSSRENDHMYRLLQSHHIIQEKRIIINHNHNGELR